MSKPANENEAKAAAASPGAEAPSEKAVEGEEQDLAELQKDLDRIRDQALRTQADFENYRKRTVREKEDAVRYANASLLGRLIPILDNFELGLEAAKTHATESPIVSGMEMVGKQLQDLLAAHGVELIPDPAGSVFDAKVHEALSQEPSEKVEEGHVIRQLRKGYKLKDRLLRPANVIVSKGAAKQTASR